MDFKTICETSKSLSENLFSGQMLKYREKVAGSLLDVNVLEHNREKYKYTPLADIFDGQYVFDAPQSEVEADIPVFDAIKIVTINGQYAAGGEIRRESGFVYGNLAAASNSAEYGEIVQKYCGKIADAADLPAALSLATALSGVFIAVEPKIKTTRPLLIVNITDAAKPALAISGSLMVFGDHSSAKILICNVNKSSAPTLANVLSETFIGKNANIDIAHLSEGSKSSKMVFSDCYMQDENSSLTHTNIILGGGLVRRNTEIRLAGKCESNLCGLALAADKDHIDNHTFIDHAMPESTSNELYKSIVADHAVNVFNGRIRVRKNAQKTLAYQSNRNILLNTGARTYSKPQLEIHADDVKCSHGATVGQLNEEMLFYMQARGIDARTAQRLILSGFAKETLKNVSNSEFREFLSAKIENKLTV